MKLKKVFTALLIIVVIIGLSASYLITGFVPTQPTAAPDTDWDNPDFIGPTGNPSVKGPTAPPPGSTQ